MLKKLLPHALLAIIVVIVTLAQHYAFFALKNYPIYWFPFEKVLIFFLFFFLATFIKNSTARFLFLSFIVILNVGQMAHLSYFGTQILPAEYYLLFTQIGEIKGTIKEELYHILIPLMFTLIPLTVIYLAQRKLRPQFQFRFMVWVFVLYFIYNPVRTYLTGHTWGRQPSTRELSGMNVYLTFSYFMGRILPLKLSGNSKFEPNSSTALTLQNGTKSQWDKVILIVGESLSPHHMQLFGYDKQTTPFLNSQKDQKNFYFTKGLSSGVSTDISLAFFFNIAYGSSGAMKASKGDHCLIKLAKAQAFSTHFLSVQSEEQLRYISPYICTSSLDDYRSLEVIDPKNSDPNAAVDRNLLPEFKKILNEDKSQFIVLHQRGSHAPWNLRFTKEAEKFSGKDYSDPRIADYDNSVFEFDLFWKEFDEIVKPLNKKILVIYFSDHGEGLGEGGVWGHGALHKLSFEIPIIIRSYNKELPTNTNSLPQYATHYNIGLFLAETLGLVPNQKSNEVIKDYVIYGNDIDGLAGQAQINFNSDGSYDFKTSI